MVITSCSFKESPKLDNTTAQPDLSNQEAIAWIENNLTSANALKNHVSRKSIPKAMFEYKVPGVSMAFVDQGKVAWKKTYGYANLATSEKVTDNTVFTGASLSKPLTAIAALSLVESERLSLDENVNNKLEDWQVPENEFTKKEKVTLRHLISHRAGVKNDLWSSYLPEQSVPSLTQMLAGQHPSVDPATSIITTPGSIESYSNPGYSIIQKMIEDVTNKSFEHVLDELVLQPSEMNDSSFQQPIPEYLRARKAVGYDETVNAYSYKLFPYKAAGGVWTTPSDMARFIITLFKDYDGQHNILPTSMVEEVFSRNEVRLAFSKIYNENSEDLIFRHYGSNQGFTCYLVGSVLKRQAIVVMTNSDNGFELLDYIARAVAEFYQWDYLQPTIHMPYKAEASELENYTGHYLNNDKKITFSVDNNALTIKLKPSDNPQTLTHIGPGEFISTEDSVKYQFLRPRGESTGPFVWLRITSNGGSDSYVEKIN